MDETFNYEKRKAKRAAKDLCYPPVVQELLEKAKTSSEISRIMKTARKGGYKDEQVDK